MFDEFPTEVLQGLKAHLDKGTKDPLQSLAAFAILVLRAGLEEALAKRAEEAKTK